MNGQFVKTSSRLCRGTDNEKAKMRSQKRTEIRKIGVTIAHQMEHVPNGREENRLDIAAQKQIQAHYTLLVGHRTITNPE